jgi:Flp pilus assembly protein TadD
MFAKAIQINGEFAEPHNNLAVIAQRAGRLDLAEQHLRRAVQIDAQSAKSWKNLGLVLMLRGQAAEAAAALQRAVELGGPDGAEAQRRLEKLRNAAQTQPDS